MKGPLIAFVKVSKKFLTKILWRVPLKKKKLMQWVGIFLAHCEQHFVEQLILWLAFFQINRRIKFRIPKFRSEKTWTICYFIRLSLKSAKNRVQSSLFPSQDFISPYFRDQPHVLRHSRAKARTYEAKLRQFHRI